MTAWKRRPTRWQGLPTAIQAGLKKKRAKPRKLEEPILFVCLQWLRLAFDGMVYHCPNGLDAGSEVIFIRGKPVPRAAVMWKKLEKLGARNGVLDLTLHWKDSAGIGRTAYLEIKSAEGHYTKGQIEVMEDLDRCGIPSYTCRSLEDCQFAARSLGLPLRGGMRYSPS